MSQFQPPQSPFPQGSGYPQWQSPSQPLTPQPQPQYTSPQAYYPPQPQNQPPPVTPTPKVRPPKKQSPLAWLISGLIVGVIIGYAVHVPGSPPSTPNTSTTPIVQTTTSTDQSTPTSQPTIAPQVWTTTHTFTGSGDKKTEIFTAPGDWKILSTCTYQNNSGYTADGLFGLSVYGSDGTILDANAIFVTCKNGVAKTTAETEEHQGGQVYLEMNATGDWTVQIQELK